MVSVSVYSFLSFPDLPSNIMWPVINFITLGQYIWNLQEDKINSKDDMYDHGHVSFVKFQQMFVHSSSVLFLIWIKFSPSTKLKTKQQGNLR